MQNHTPMRIRAFTGRDAAAKYQRAGHWLLASVFENERARAWCEKNAVPLRKAQGESTDSTGGNLVPTELAAVILDLRDSYGAFRRRARILPMGRDSVTVGRRAAGGITATFTAENTAGTATNATIDGTTLTVRKLLAILSVSTELEDDALPDIVDYLANEVAWAFAQKEDDCAFNGDGSSTYGQMVGIASIPSTYKSHITALHNTYATLTTADLASLMGGVRASAIGRAAWFISQLGFAITMAGEATQGVINFGDVDGVRTPFYLGFPVILTQKLPQVTSSLTTKLMLAFGDMYAAGILGQRRAITIARSDQRYADTDQIAIVASERIHAVIQDIGDASNYGSIAGLFGS